MSIVTEGAELVPVERLHPHPRNARRGNLDAIRRSIRAHGFWGAITARPDGTILVGAHRFKVAVEEGYSELPVLWADVDDDTALAMVLDDNRSSDLGGYDDEALLDLLHDAGSRGLEVLYSESDLLDLMRSTGRAEREASSFLDGLEDETPAEAQIKVGHGDWVQASFVISSADRQAVWDRLDKVMADRGLDTRAAALVALCRE